jgi:hypothetical protein
MFRHKTFSLNLAVLVALTMSLGSCDGNVGPEPAFDLSGLWEVEFTSAGSVVNFPGLGGSLEQVTGNLFLRQRDRALSGSFFIESRRSTCVSVGSFPGASGCTTSVTEFKGRVDGDVKGRSVTLDLCCGLGSGPDDHVTLRGEATSAFQIRGDGWVASR